MGESLVKALTTRSTGMAKYPQPRELSYSLASIPIRVDRENNDNNPSC
jgi:hypothetical protein